MLTRVGWPFAALLRRLGRRCRRLAGTGPGGRWCFLRQLGVKLEHDLVADQDAAVVENLVPADFEILAVDLAGGMHSAHGCTEGSLGGRRRTFDLENDRLGDAVKGQVAGNLQPLAGLLDLGRLEGRGRILGDVEKVGRFEVAVALRLMAC